MLIHVQLSIYLDFNKKKLKAYFFCLKYFTGKYFLDFHMFVSKKYFIVNHKT